MEVLHKCWNWLKENCVEVILKFWGDGILTLGTTKGVIRLIPKLGELLFLRNWRAITLMNLLYKIISKLLTIRLKLVLGLLVDDEQIGFIIGRRILDNILAFHVGKDFVKSKHLRALFVMWDFFKAYDHLAHMFLWATLVAMGFSPLFIQLVKGLVIGGSSVIHANGLFSNVVDLC